MVVTAPSKVAGMAAWLQASQWRSVSRSGLARAVAAEEATGGHPAGVVEEKNRKTGQQPQLAPGGDSFAGALPAAVLAAVLVHMQSGDLWPDADKLLILQRRQKWFTSSSSISVPGSHAQSHGVNVPQQRTLASAHASFMPTDISGTVEGEAAVSEARSFESNSSLEDSENTRSNADVSASASEARGPVPDIIDDVAVRRTRTFAQKDEHGSGSSAVNESSDGTSSTKRAAAAEYRVLLALDSSARSGSRKNQVIAVAHARTASEIARDLIFLCKQLDDELTAVGSANVSDHHLLEFFDRISADASAAAQVRAAAVLADSCAAASSRSGDHNKLTFDSRPLPKQMLDDTSALPIPSSKRHTHSSLVGLTGRSPPSLLGSANWEFIDHPIHPLLSIMRDPTSFSGSRNALDVASVSAAIQRCSMTGASLDIRDQSGRTFAHFLCQGSSGSLAADVSRSSKSPLSLAAAREASAVELIKVLNRFGADFNLKDDSGWTPLHCACHSAQLVLVNFLIRAGVHILSLTQDGSTALSYLVRHNLLADPRATGAGVERGGASHEIDLLSSKLKKLHGPTRTQIECVKLLLERGAMIDAGNHMAETPLHRAALSGSLPMTAFLIDRGSDVNQINRVGETALHHAARAGRLLMASFLVERGADVTVKGVAGETASQVAARLGYKELSNLLLHMRERPPTIVMGKNTAPSLVMRREDKAADGTSSRLTITGLMTGSFYDSDDEAEIDLPADIVAKSDDTLTSSSIQSWVRAAPDSNVERRSALLSALPPSLREPISLVGSRAADSAVSNISTQKTATNHRDGGGSASDSDEEDEDEDIASRSRASAFSDNLESARPASNSVVSAHLFRPESFAKPTWCCQCQGFIWGRGFRCYAASCDYIVHRYCKKEAQFFTPCAGMPDGSRHQYDISGIPSKLIRIFGDDAKRFGGGKVWSLIDKYSDVFTFKELDVLYLQYNTMDTDQDGKITCDQLRTGLGSIMSDPVLSGALFRVMDEDGDGHLSFAEFVKGMATLQKGSRQNQLSLGFRLFRPRTNYLEADNRHIEVISRRSFEAVLRSMDRSLGAIHFRQLEVMADAVFKKRDHITEPEFIAAMTAHELFVRSLGLVGDLDCVHAPVDHGSPLLQPCQPKPDSGNHRKGINITFGHSSWELCYHMHFGIRIAVGEATASYRRLDHLHNSHESAAASISSSRRGASLFGSPNTKAGAADLIGAAPVVDYALNAITAAARAHAHERTVNSLSDYDVALLPRARSTATLAQWIFRDYAPAAFWFTREELGIDPKEYMYSLGPEKILGNLLMGSLGALCEMVSTGRSGSFFFKSIDRRYLIKTLPPEEHALLQGMVIEYCDHLQRYPNSLLTRFCGLHAMRKLHDKKVRGDIYFAVMQNAFPEWLSSSISSDSPDALMISRLTQIDEQYDLKGSTVNRHTPIPEGAFLADVAQKDNDLKWPIKLGPLHKALLLEQVEADTKFLLSHGICDYSFLLGVHFLDDAEKLWVANHPPPSVIWRRDPRLAPQRPYDRSVFCNDWGGILSEDGRAIYFICIIDVLTTFTYRKAGERLAKSLFNDASQISAVPARPYQKRFQAYLSQIVE